MMEHEPQPFETRIAALDQMLKEFQSHKERLAERAKEISGQLTSGDIADVAALGLVVVELFREVHDTGLSFQAELTELIHSDWVEQAAADEQEEDDDDDGAEDPGDDDPSQLLPGDAAQLRRTTTEYIAVLDAMLAPENRYDAAQRKQLGQKKADAEESLALVNAIELRDDEDHADAGPPSTQPS